MIEKAILKLKARDAVSAEEEGVLRGADSPRRRYHSDKHVVRAGEELSVSILLLDGLMCRYKDLQERASARSWSCTSPATSSTSTPSC